MFDGKKFGDEIVQAVKGYVDPLRNQIAMLEARLAELETSRKEFRYVGPWRDGRQYEMGNFSTCGGSLWHCEEATQSRPGTDSSWKLCVKSGAFHETR
jgi:hypothetical protein